jgi:hypothetical protein
MALRVVAGALAALLPATVYVALGAPAAPAEEKTESRLQAVLQVYGTHLPDGGLQITETPAEGPGANLESPKAAPRTRGALEKGDVITTVEGQGFRDRRALLDLLNAAYRNRDGKVRITVKHARTNRFAVWVVRPVVVRLDVPASDRPPDFPAELGKPVPKAPPPPAVPATINP